MVKKEVGVPVLTVVNVTVHSGAKNDSLHGDPLELEALGKLLSEAGCPNFVGQCLTLEDKSFKVFTPMELVSGTRTLSLIKVSSQISFIEG